MSRAIENIQAAMQLAETARPKVGGFPVLAEIFRQEGVYRNQWELPSCQSTFHTNEGAVVAQLQPLISGMAEIPAFDREALIRSIRIDQAGESTFPEFLAAAWKAGVVRYEVDFISRSVTYCGVNGEKYIELYPAVIL